MTPNEIEARLRAVPRLPHDDGDHVVPDYPALARLGAELLQEEREACAHIVEHELYLDACKVGACDHAGPPDCLGAAIRTRGKRMT